MDFRQRMDARIAYYTNSCGANGISFDRLITKTPYDLALLRYLEKRQRLH